MLPSLWWADPRRLESEGFDIKSLDLPAGQDDLIEAVAKANRHTVVVINAGGPVVMTKWIAQVPAILDMWYDGQEGGTQSRIFFLATRIPQESSRFPL